MFTEEQVLFLRIIKTCYNVLDVILCLFSVKSAFSWCVDGDLLKRNNLISPQDYIPTQKPRVEVPAASMLHSLRN